MPRLALIAMLLTLGGASPVWAKSPASSADQPREAVTNGAAFLFVSWDQDRDDAASKAEAEQGAAAEFQRAAAGAEVLTPLAFDEWSKRALGGLRPYRLEFDADVDNRITRKEFIDEILQTFAALDKDADARLTRAEMVRELPGRADKPSRKKPPR